MIEQFKILAEKHGLSLVVLFGSMAKGTARPTSDIDLAVWIGNFRDRNNCVSAARYRELYRDFTRAFETDRVHLAILNHATPLLLNEVARHGRPVYQKEEGLFTEFCVRAVKLHEDAQPFYKMEREFLERYYGGNSD